MDDETQEYMTEGQRLAMLRWDESAKGKVSKEERSALGRNLVRNRRAGAGRKATVKHKGGEMPARGCRCVGCRRARGER